MIMPYTRIESHGENWEEPYKVKTTFLERTYYLVDLVGKVIFQV